MMSEQKGSAPGVACSALVRARWTDGVPANLAAAVEDAIVWLDAAARHANWYDGPNRQRARLAANALREHAERVEAENERLQDELVCALIGDEYAKLRTAVEGLHAALSAMRAVFRPRDGEPGPDMHVEVEACALADDALGAFAPEPALAA